jgi:predicted acetyltransferase
MVSLFASTRQVYRKCGFDLAGSEILYEADLSSVPDRTDAAFEALDPRDPRIADAYRRKAAAGAGLLRREAVHWLELLRPPTDGLAAYGTGGRDLEAYVILDTRDPTCLEVRDWHAASGNAASALLAFLGRFRSVYPIARWHGGPQDDLVDAMPDKGWRLVHQEEWLARVVNPKAALQARRYLPEQATLGIRVLGSDGGCTARLTLEVADGAGRVEDGQPPERLPTVTVQEAAFASLLTGFRSATVLERRGVLSGDAQALRTCDLVFLGPPPWVAEHF